MSIKIILALITIGFGSCPTFAQVEKNEGFPKFEVILSERNEIFPFFSESINKTVLKFSYFETKYGNSQEEAELFSLVKPISYQGIVEDFGLTILIAHEIKPDNSVVFSGRILISTPTSDIWGAKRLGNLTVRDLSKYESSTRFQFVWKRHMEHECVLNVPSFNYQGEKTERELILKVS